MELAADMEIIKKWGKTITFNETKYEISEFLSMLEDNQDFFDELKQNVIDKIKNVEIKIEEDVESED